MSAPFDPMIAKYEAPSVAIEVTGLTKIYAGAGQKASKTALDNISLSIPRGTIFGLLGPNGAGKSTLINILAGLVIKTSGSARIWGYDINKETRNAKSSIGVVPQELNLDAFFTPRELLEQQAGLYGVPQKERRTDELLEALNLTDVAHSFSHVMSGGMRRRLMVAKAMVHRPPVLVLDEPTAGVDVGFRHELWDGVRKMNELGTTILLTTHYLEEAEQLCSSIAILDHGKIVANDTKENLLNDLDSKEVSLTLPRDVAEVPSALAKQGWKLSAPNKLTLAYRPSQTSIGQALLSVQAYGLPIKDISVKEADLEELFLSLTGGSPKA